MKIICISDTHEQHAKLGWLPERDVLIHAGDWTFQGRLDRLTEAADGFSVQPARYKIAIAGNHDLAFSYVWWQAARDIFQSRGIDYLEDGAITVDGLRFWGSPWTPEFCNWAFNQDEQQAKERWRPYRMTLTCSSRTVLSAACATRTDRAKRAGALTSDNASRN